MSYRELCILLPCHSLEDFPLHHTGAEADNLLATWTCLWHPALISVAESAPQWRRADDPPSELVGRLIALPTVSKAALPAGFLQRARDEGATVLRDETRVGLLDRASSRWKKWRIKRRRI